MRTVRVNGEKQITYLVSVDLSNLESLLLGEVCLSSVPLLVLVHVPGPPREDDEDLKSEADTASNQTGCEVNENRSSDIALYCEMTKDRRTSVVRSVLCLEDLRSAHVANACSAQGRSVGSR